MSEKKLREALEFYACEDNWRDFTPDCWEKVKNVLYRCNKHGYEEAQQALSEAGEPEMLRLLRWLEKKERWAKKRSQRYGKNFPNLRMTAETNAGGYRNVIEEIKDTFGYTLPKEEYVDRDSDDLDLDEMADHKLW